MMASVLRSGTQIRPAEQPAPEDGQGLWNDLLAETLSRRKGHSLDEDVTKNVVFVGHKNSGKSSLLARLQGIEAVESRFEDYKKPPISHGAALDYSFIDLHEGEELIARMHCWQQNPQHAELLEFAVNERNIEKVCIVITLDFSSPWTLSDTLAALLELVRAHVEAVLEKLPAEKRQELQKRQETYLRSYSEPRPELAPRPTAVPAPGDGPAPPMSKLALLRSYSSAAVTRHSSIGHDLTASGDDSSATAVSPATPAADPATASDDSLPPLPDGVLSVNLGVPLVVVCHKSDAAGWLEAELGYRDDRLSFVHQRLRAQCLPYGAALMYCSSKNDVNCSLLLAYVQHRLYGFPFRNPPILMTSASTTATAVAGTTTGEGAGTATTGVNSVKEALFVPAGWDSPAKVALESENHKFGEKPFSEVILDPEEARLAANTAIHSLRSRSPTPGGLGDERSIFAEDDPEFLLRHYASLEKEKEKDKERRAAAAAAAASGIITEGVTSPPASPASEHASGGSGSPVPASLDIFSPPGSGGAGGAGLTVPTAGRSSRRSSTFSKRDGARYLAAMPKDDSSLGATASSGADPLAGVDLPNMGSPTGSIGKGDHKMLASFFQKLLSGGENSPPATPTGPPTGRARASTTGTPPLRKPLPDMTKP